ncbi:AAA family ATPase [Pseudomonas abyssi]|jgi:5-methylcytosine-specific restriction protein B|nr:AAA family ATPase [Pseudomonas abyssi]|tara:strand:- start:5733 stop:8294 length:2562 start_codon:yes stop_codon:yes gene_type:complete
MLTNEYLDKVCSAREGEEDIRRWVQMVLEAIVARYPDVDIYPVSLRSRKYTGLGFGCKSGSKASHVALGLAVFPDRVRLGPKRKTPLRKALEAAGRTDLIVSKQDKLADRAAVDDWLSTLEGALGQPFVDAMKGNSRRPEDFPVPELDDSEDGSAQSGAIEGYPDRRVTELLRKGSEEDKAWFWTLISTLRQRFPTADHYTVNLDPTDVRVGSKARAEKSGKVAFRIRWSKDGFTCDARDLKNHLALLQSQGIEEQINSRVQVDQPQINAWLDAVINAVSLEALPLEGEGRMPRDYENNESQSNDAGESTAHNGGSTGLPPLNQILFGPPGTGKTYNTINEALKILAPQFWEQNSGDDPDSRKRLKEAFDELVDKERIRFVTFHQSFSYEDFVEGLRARTDETTGQLRYDVVDGVFKSLCEAAASKVTQQADAPAGVGARRVWKMSLGNTLGDDASIFQECIDGGYVLLGYGGGINFAGCANRQQVQARFADNNVLPDNPVTDYGITSVTAFVAKMKVGDLIVVSDGNFKFRAIGEVTGNYEFKPHNEFDDGYSQLRAVKWLRHYQPSLPHSELLNGQFSQMTLYELRAPTLNKEKLEQLLGAGVPEGRAENDARVLIIDEINRGSVSRIFGELITLIEESKRAGRAEALSIVLPYSQTRFSVPDNLYIIGTMNTADRSLAGLDIALRRRFAFKEMPPKLKPLDGVQVAGVSVRKLLKVMNQRIEVLLDRDHCLGHAYFMPLKEDGLTEEQKLARLELIFRNQILPLLQEYFFEDWQRICWVLNDHRKPDLDRFVGQVEQDVAELFGVANVPVQGGVWRINDEAFKRASAYAGIIAANYKGEASTDEPEEADA